MRSIRRRAAIVLTAALLAPAASAEVWQWTDSEGVVRYTPNPDRVPAAQRGSLIKVEPGMKAPPPSPARPPVLYAPPEELPLGADPFAAPEPARTLEAPPTEPLIAPEPEVSGPPEAETRTSPTPRDVPGESEVPPVPLDEPRTPRAAPSEPPAPDVPPGDAPEPPPAPRPLTDEERARRAELEEQIAADQEALKRLISQASTEGGAPLRESQELREIARRLPVLQAELRALDGLPERREERSAPQP
jgi:hypothetical protein